jgi:hypothetical protein
MEPIHPNADNARVFNQLKNRLAVGAEEQQHLIQSVANLVIRDKLASPTATTFRAEDKTVYISYAGDPKEYTIHKHALQQLSTKVGFPIVYLNALGKPSQGGWKTDLLAHNLNELFHKEEFKDRSGAPRFLHRIVGNQLRGFLSRRFNRHIASAPLLRAYLAACAEASAFAFDATTSDIKIALKCMLPHVFMPVPGQYVCVGVEWGNSDFGAGRMQVALSVWNPQGNRFSVLDQVLSRVHIGSVIEDSDIELSEETAKKECEAQASAIKDAVLKQLSPESIDRLLDAIRRAHEEQIPWDKLKAHLSRFISKVEVENLQKMLEEESYDLPPIRHDVDGPVPTKWWAANALSFLAEKATDAEKKLDLQHAAGSFLEVK